MSELLASWLAFVFFGLFVHHGILLAVREDQKGCLLEVTLAFSLCDGPQCVSPMLIVWTVALESDGFVQLVDVDCGGVELSSSCTSSMRGMQRHIPGHA